MLSGGRPLTNSEFDSKGSERVRSGGTTSADKNQPQSKTTAPANVVAPVVSDHQTTQFVETDPGEILTFKEAGTRGVYEPIAPSIDLANFLSRPVHIYTYTWSPSTWSTVHVYPWNSFLGNSVVKNKLNNFPYIRGKLKIKVVLNGSPFHYGAMRMHYYPMYGFQPPRVRELPTDGSALIPYSQQPGIFLYPQSSTGGEMECPFFYHRDYLPLMSLSETTNMGRLTLTEFVPLRSANGTFSTGVTLSVYAWMEDVQLAGFTSASILQSDEYDEAVGPISKPAAMLANWSSYLERVPIIGRFATATRIGSGAISQIASIFGWSNVPIVSSVMPMKNLPFHDLASAEISQPVSKFTLDPKAEVSVSPYMVGLDGTDELAFSNIVQRDSYLTQFTWNTSDTPNTLFFSAVVNPMMYDAGSYDSYSTLGIQMTPMCMVSRMFRYWRGDIIFTFRIIASKFHRGRLRVHWEPYATLSQTSDASNVTMTKVIDIEDATDIEFRVPYLQAVPWCEHMHQGDLVASNRWSTSSVKSASKDDDNGSLVVRCLNNLSAPVDTAPVTVMVFVRGAENLQFANPMDLNNKYSYIEPQSDNGVEEVTKVDENLFLKNWGEPILSARKLLRRSTLVDIKPLFLGSDPSSLVQESRYPMTKYPPHPGYAGSAFDTSRSVKSSSLVPFNYSAMTPFSWIIPCFLGLRGSMRWHLNVISHNASGPDSIAIMRDPGVVVAAPSQVTIVASGSTTRSKYGCDVFNNVTNFGSSGVVLTNYEGQPGLSAEMPFMIPYKFYINNFISWVNGSSVDKSNADGYKIIVRINNNDNNQDMALERYCSIGTDFNAHFFLCVPTLYYNPNAGSYAT